MDEGIIEEAELPIKPVFASGHVESGLEGEISHCGFGFVNRKNLPENLQKMTVFRIVKTSYYSFNGSFKVLESFGGLASVNFVPSFCAITLTYPLGKIQIEHFSGR